MVRFYISPQFKALRFLWRCAYWTLYRYSPTPLHGWRRLVLRVFGADIGAHCHPYPSGDIWFPRNLEMREFSCIAPGAWIYNVAKVSLGEHSIVSQQAMLCTASHDFRDPAFPLLAAPIEVGKFAWIAARAFVGPGVVIGDHAIVGAQCALFSDLEARHVAVGNPAMKRPDPVGRIQTHGGER